MSLNASMKLCGFATVIPFEHMRIRSESESLYIPVVTSVYSRPILPHSVAASLALLEIGIPTVPRVHMRFRLKSQRPSIFNELGGDFVHPAAHSNLLVDSPTNL